ncbi:MAG: uracil-DNA glycosylase [Pseudomonadota bacterium]
MRALLRWYAEMGVTEAVSDQPTNSFSISDQTIDLDHLSDATSHAERRAHSGRTAGFSAGGTETFDDLFDPPSKPSQRPSVVVTPTEATSTADQANSAKALADSCHDLTSLIAAIESFDGCPLKKGARSTVVFDGTLDADLVVIGEAPGRDEDRMGKPFVGKAGQLLDKMLTAIDYERTTNVLITNVVYWRPPGNRAPTDDEVAICRPFFERFLALAKPAAVAIMGGVALKALTGKTGITRARGKWCALEVPPTAAPDTADRATIDALPMFHPAFLLRRPEQKRLAWADLQALAQKLNEG